MLCYLLSEYRSLPSLFKIDRKLNNFPSNPTWKHFIVRLLLFLLIPHTCLCAISVIDLLSSFLYQNVRPQIIFVSKFGFVFFTLTRGTSLQSLFLTVLSLLFRLFSCSSVQSLLGPKNHGWSQKEASLRDKVSLSFHLLSNIIKPAGAGETYYLS